MLMILVPTICRRLHDKEKLFMAIGAAWTAVVAFTRLRMGAHFLSDVCVSSLLTIGFGALAVWLFYFNPPSLAASGSFSPAKPPAKSSLCRKKAEKSSPIQRIGELLCRYTVSGSVKS